MTGELSDYQKTFSSAEYDLTVGSVRALRTFGLMFTGTKEAHGYQPRSRLLGHWGGQWVDGENVSQCRRWSKPYENIHDAAIAWLGNPNRNWDEIEMYAGLAPDAIAASLIRNGELRMAMADDTNMYQFINKCSGDDLLNCTCGYYGMWDMGFLQYTGSFAVGVVEHYGKTLLGTAGVRSTKGRILALTIVHPDAEGDPHKYHTGEERKIPRTTLDEEYTSVEIFRGPSFGISRIVNKMLDKYPTTNPKDL